MGEPIRKWPIFSQFLIFPIFMIYFPKCEGKGTCSFQKSKIKSLINCDYSLICQLKHLLWVLKQETFGPGSLTWILKPCILDVCPLTLKAPIATKIVCFSRLLKCLRSLYGKQCGPRSDCSYRRSLFWVHTVMLSNYLQQTTSADNIFRCIFFLAL